MYVDSEASASLPSRRKNKESRVTGHRGQRRGGVGDGRLKFQFSFCPTLMIDWILIDLMDHVPRGLDVEKPGNVVPGVLTVGLVGWAVFISIRY